MNPQDKKITLTFPNYPAPDGSIVTQKWSASTLRQLPYYKKLLAEPQLDDLVIVNEHDPKLFAKVMALFTFRLCGVPNLMRAANFYGLEVGEPVNEPVIREKIVELYSLEDEKLVFDFGDLTPFPREIISAKFLPPIRDVDHLTHLVLGKNEIRVASLEDYPLTLKEMINMMIPALDPSERKDY